jgi:hypothetical protein
VRGSVAHLNSPVLVKLLGEPAGFTADVQAGPHHALQLARGP